jgi:hypothetical protein
MYGNIVIHNPIRRHVSDFWNFRHDRVESDSRWRGVDQVFIVNMDDRPDRWDSVLRELAVAHAPFDRITRVTGVAIPGNSTSINGTIGCISSHLEVIRRARRANYNHVLVLEDDFTFTSDLEQHLNDLAAFFDRGYDYWICMVAPSKYGPVQPLDDLVSRSFQRVTNTGGYLMSSRGAAELLPVWDAALEGLRSTGEIEKYAADRSWAALQPSGKFWTFRRKFGFQASSYSLIQDKISRSFD